MGDPIVVHMIFPDGKTESARLGLRLDSGEVPQFTVPGNCWFASGLIDGGQWGLAACTVAPGFDFADFELAERRKLAADYPQHHGLIESFTR